MKIEKLQLFIVLHFLLVPLIDVSESIAVIVLVLLVAHTITIVVLKVVKETIAIVISVL